MKLRFVLLCSVFAILSILLTGCWAKRCPMASCHTHGEHRHEGGTYRERPYFSFVTTRKHWIWDRPKGKSFKGKKDKKTGKTKFKYLLPGEKVDFEKKN